VLLMHVPNEVFNDCGSDWVETRSWLIIHDHLGVKGERKGEEGHRKG
jgi:hypothetical protein